MNNYLIIRNEIKKYGKYLDKKNEIIALSKYDLHVIKKQELINIVQKETGKKPIIFSNLNKQGIRSIVNELFKQVMLFNNDNKKV